MVELPTVIDYLKIRGSLAQVGSDTEPYQLYEAYSVQLPYNGYSVLRVPQTKLNSGLKPEITSSFEIGTDVRLLGNSIGLDFSCYSQVTKDQIIDITVPPTSGYNKVWINA